MNEKYIELKNPLLDLYEHIAMTKGFAIPYRSREEVGQDPDDWSIILDYVKTYGPIYREFDALAHIFFTPGEPARCIGSGDIDFRMECCCDECDYYLQCFPEENKPTP